jgi:hypothetical protein
MIAIITLHKINNWLILLFQLGLLLFNEAKGEVVHVTKIYMLSTCRHISNLFFLIW